MTAPALPAVLSFLGLLSAPGLPAAMMIGPVSGPAVIPVAGRANHDWPKYCADLGMTGQARSETRISPSTATTLNLLWQKTLPGPIASSPTVVSGRVYVGDWSGNEWELDAATGSVIASANLGTTTAPQCNPPTLGITSAPAVDRGAIYLAGGDDSFYCLDATTLQTKWKTKLGDNSAQGGYYGWCSPSPLGGRIFQGISSNCDDPFVDGQVVAMDESTGGILAAADLAETADPDYFGSGVWSSPAIDLDGRSVFVTTASAYQYSDGLAYSVVRLALDDLSILDYWKIALEDYDATSDADWGSSPTLFRDSTGRNLVGAGQKDGHYYAFDRSRLSAGPVWSQMLAPGGDCPQCSQGSISTAAFDGVRLYVGGGTATVGGVPYPGAVTSLDPATGSVLWRYGVTDGPVLAPISEANGVIFADGGRSCIALDSATGALLWSSRSEAPIYGGFAISDGRIYFGDTSGAFYCFAVSSSQEGSSLSPGGPFPSTKTAGTTS